MEMTLRGEKTLYYKMLDAINLEAFFCSKTTENVKENTYFEKVLYSAFRNTCL